MDRQMILRLGVVGVLVLGLLSLVVEEIKGTRELGGLSEATSFLTVTFLDVGQGDAILVETPDGVDVLIDGGPDGTILRELSRELSWFDRTIDLVVGTHPDKDHIAGLVDVFSRYIVGGVITTENRGETMTATTYYESVVAETSNITMARANQVYSLGASTTLTIYSPARDPSMLESNLSSIVLKVSYGDIDFLLTGDAPQSIEDYLVATYGGVLQSEVLKLGHHGSKTSSSDLFLKTVKPTYAVVSAGEDNGYGHPHAEVVERVLAAKIKILNTAESGRIKFVTDGEKVWLE